MFVFLDWCLDFFDIFVLKCGDLINFFFFFSWKWYEIVVFLFIFYVFKREVFY